MGLLRSEHRAVERTLSARTLIGRSAACALRLEETWVSGEHASVWFRDGRWWIRDLGSRNGTWVDDTRLAPGDERPLRVGSVLRFGEPDEGWTLVEAGAPRARARELGGDAVVDSQGGLLQLPPGGEPEVSVLRLPDGTWRADGDDESLLVEDGHTVVAGNRPWRLMLPVELDPTVAERLPLALHFRVSADEEIVEVDLTLGGTLQALPTRSANYLLLLLARQRTADAALPPSEQGWVFRTVLAQQLALQPRSVNVQLHRLRQCLAELGHGLAGRVIEQRGSRAGQVRLGVVDVSEERAADGIE